MPRGKILAPTLALGLFVLSPGSARPAADFSVDVDSPEATSRLIYDESDIAEATGLQIQTDGALLGLQEGPSPADPDDELDGFSYGRDFLREQGPRFFISLLFSVSDATVGGGATVSTQVAGNGAAGDQFRLLVLANGNRVGPFLEADSTAHNLTPKPATESELDGLSEPAGTREGIFFTVDRQTAQRKSYGPSDIMYVANPGVDAPVPYLTAAQMGLVAGDNVDCIMVEDRGTLGVLDAFDLVFVSLDAQSPSRPGSEAIFQAFPGPLTPVIGFRALDLSNANSEEVDACTSSDPGILGGGIEDDGGGGGGSGAGSRLTVGPLVLNGDPVAGGGSFDFVGLTGGPPTISADGETFVFEAQTPGSLLGSSLFKAPLPRGAAVDSSQAVPLTVPSVDPDGREIFSVFTDFERSYPVNNGERVAFQTNHIVDNGDGNFDPTRDASALGLMFHDDTIPTVVAQQGAFRDPADPSVVLTLSPEFSLISLRNDANPVMARSDDAIAFLARDRSDTLGLYRLAPDGTPGSPDRLVQAGEAAPGGGSFTNFSHPVMSAGFLTFVATTDTGSGIYAWTPGTGLAAAVLEGQPAPGTGDAFDAFTLAGNPNSIPGGVSDAGEIAFAVGLAEPPAACASQLPQNNVGVYRARLGGGPPQLLARTGGSPVATDAGDVCIDRLENPLINAAGDVILAAFTRMLTLDPQSFNPFFAIETFWRVTPEGLRLVAGSDLSLDNQPPGESALPQLGSSIDSFYLNARGDVVFSSFLFSGPGFFHKTREGNVTELFAGMLRYERGGQSFERQVVELDVASVSTGNADGLPSPLSDQNDFLVMALFPDDTGGVFNLRPAADEDADNVADAVETNAPNQGDGNQDGVPDAEQPNVASAPNAVDGRYLTVVAQPVAGSSDAPVLSQVTPRPVPSGPGGPPPGVEFPFGAVSFQVEGIAPGGSAEIEIHFEGGATPQSLHKFGREPGDRQEHWYLFPATIEPGLVRYTVTDGGAGDNEILENRIIRDPAVPAFPVPEPGAGLATLALLTGLALVRRARSRRRWLEA